MLHTCNKCKETIKEQEGFLCETCKKHIRQKDFDSRQSLCLIAGLEFFLSLGYPGVSAEKNTIYAAPYLTGTEPSKSCIELLGVFGWEFDEEIGAWQFICEESINLENLENF